MPLDALGSRYGIFLHASIATVPAYAPVGEYAEWYWSHLSGERLADVLLHPAPLPEVQHWHAAHHPGMAYDDFIPDLTFERFDAPAFLDLVTGAGAGYLVHVTKHHDGYCWWDSRLTDRTSAKSGPHRDICAELHAACRANQVTYGAYHSLLDWAHPVYPDQHAYVEAYLRPQVDELCERFDPAVLWADGHWGQPRGHWQAEAIRASYGGLMNDRWGWGFPGDFATPEYDLPEADLGRPWELCRGLTHSFGYNQVEGPDDHLTPTDIVSLLVRTVARGGNLLLNVGIRADGSVPDLQADALRSAGEWVRHHDALIERSVPWATPGDDATAYAASPDGRTVHAVDRLGRRRLTLPDLAGATAVADRSGRAVTWRRDGDDLVVDRPRWLEDEPATAYDIAVEPLPRIVVNEPPPPPVTLRAGEVLRGGTVGAVVLAGDGARLEGVTVTGGIAAGGAADIVLVDCTVTGPHALGPGITLQDCDRALVEGCRQRDVRWGTGIDVVGGTDVRLVRNEVTGNLAGIRLAGTVGAAVTGNRVSGRWWGIHLDGGTGATVEGNVVRRTMRAYTVSGGSGHVLDGNTAERCDSGVLVEGGADVAVHRHVANGCCIEHLFVP